MKKNLLLLLLCFISVASVYAEPSLANFPADENAGTLQETLSFDPKIIAKYQEAAGMVKSEDLKELIAAKTSATLYRFTPRGFIFSVDTYTISYEIINGVLYHVGWYTDGCVMTNLDGYETGKQIVFRNGAAVAVTYVVDFYDGYFVHYYPGGVIYSYSNYQLFVPY